MTFDLKRFAVAGVTAALALSMAACHGGSPASPSYIPDSSSAVSSPQSGGAGDLARTKSPIISLCGNVIKIKLLGTTHCRFSEKGYNGQFALFNHVPGILNLSPLLGDDKTDFLLGGLALGDGFFIVKDLRRHSLLVKVRITLL
jgi:hypothetical protein